MHKVTPSSIESLLQQKNEKVLSIYLPTHQSPTPPHMQEDQTRFKNLIRAGRDKWEEQSDKQSIEKIYQQLEDKLDSTDFWQQTSKGMAVFATTSDIEIFHLPIECEERVFVGDQHDITPLLMLMTYNQPYYILVLAMHDTKLLRGDIYGLEPVEIDFPTSPENALNIDEMFSGSQTVRAHQGGGAASPHGQGDSQEAGREERLQYFRIIEHMIADSDQVDNTLPIIVAGTDSESGDYKQMSKLPTLLHAYVQGNHTHTSLQELHTMTWPLIRRETVEAKIATLVHAFEEKRASDKSSDDIAMIQTAAKAGRVETLLLRLIRTTADSVSDTKQGSIPIISFPDDYDDHTVELAHDVCSQGGEIVGLTQEAMPNASIAAALLRY